METGLDSDISDCRIDLLYDRIQRNLSDRVSHAVPPSSADSMDETERERILGRDCHFGFIFPVVGNSALDSRRGSCMGAHGCEFSGSRQLLHSFIDLPV